MKNGIAINYKYVDQSLFIIPSVVVANLPRHHERLRLPSSVCLFFLEMNPITFLTRAWRFPSVAFPDLLTMSSKSPIAVDEAN
jgi:hypothetical protein